MKCFGIRREREERAIGFQGGFEQGFGLRFAERG